MKDPRERFTEAASAYDRYRPSYPPDLLDWITATAGLAPGARVLDLGCGTGIASRLFAGRGFAVTGVEPNPEMRRHALERGGAIYLPGEATATGLPAASFELCIAAQAFHWFDVAPTLAEIDRVVVPGGAAAAFWNVRAHTPFLEEYEQLLRTYSSDYPATELGRSLPDLRSALAGRELHEADFANQQRLAAEAFRGRVYSAAYVVHGVARRAEFDQALDALFARHQEEGEVTFVYRTVVLLWRCGASSG